MIKKVLLVLLLIIVILLGINFKTDIPVEKLKKKYANEESEFVEVNGMNVHYRDEGNGFPVVLVHGTAASLHTWDEWTEILKKDFRIIRLDMPAFGLTGPHPEHNYSYEAYADFLNDFLVSIDVDSCHVAGNSLGGAIAWNFALRHPDKTAKLILIDASGYPIDKDITLAFTLAQKEYLNWIVRWITPKSLLRKSLKEVYYDHSKVTDTLVQRYYDLLLREGNREAFIKRMQQHQDKTHERISEITAPTLIQWGRHDDWITPENARKFHEDISRSELIIYENAAHVPMEEIPEKTALDARKFLLNNE